MAGKIETLTFINIQALIVTAIFGLFGSALTNFLGVPELKLRYISIACLLGLVLILLIKLLLKVPQKKRVKLVLKVIAVVLFIFLVISFLRFDRIFGDVTFTYTDLDTVKTNHVKGSEHGLQESARIFIEKFKKDEGRIPSDQELVDKAGGIYEKEGINNITRVWTPASILDNKRALIKSYILMAMLFLASIYFITEVLLNFFRTRKKAIPAGKGVRGKEAPQTNPGLSS